MKTRLPELSWVNGKEQCTLAVTDRGLQYGDGLFETILYLNGNPVLENEHLARLQRDCIRLRLNLDSDSLRAELVAFIKNLKAKNDQQGILKILVTRQYTTRGYAPDANARVNRLIQFFPGIQYPKKNREGIAIVLLPDRLSINPLLSGMKHLNRLEQVLAYQHLHRPLMRGLPYQEGLWLDAQQYVTEGMYSNVFMVSGGKLMTPPLDRCGVRGVMRDFIMHAVSQSLKLRVQEQRISLPELLQADEVFMCNSVYGVWPVTALEVRRYVAGSMTKAVQAAVDHLGYAQVHI